MSRVRVVGLVMLAGCPVEAEPQEELVPEMVAAVDLDPDPGVVEVRLVAAAGSVAFASTSTSTLVLGYHQGDGVVSVPGPMIEAEVGQTLRVHFENQLDEPTTVHWHGLRLPAEMDGNPMVSGAVLPGETFEYEFVLTDAGTFWYHPHVETDRQMEMGLHGALIVRDPSDPAVDAERVFFIDDLELDDAGAIVIEPSDEDIMLGRRGQLLVNGGPPALVRVVAGSHERWRLINGSNGRFLRLALDGIPLTVVAKDGGLVAEPYAVTELAIAPGERFDVIPALAGDPGERFELRTLLVDRGHDGMVDPPASVLWIELGDPLSGAVEPPSFGRELEPIADDPDTTPTRDFVLSEDLETGAGARFYINDQAWPLNTPVEVALDDVEIWQVLNDGEGQHPLHVHGLFFEVLDVDGVPRPTRALEDTLAIGPGEVARLAVRYTAPGMWMFHCQIPEHAERGMTGDLMVVP